MNVPLSQLQQIPYLDLSDWQGRSIGPLCFYDDGTWHFWTWGGDRLIKIQAWPAESQYFGTAPADPYDLHLHFFDLISQRAGFQGVQAPLVGLHEDVCNLAAAIAKIHHFYATRERDLHGVARMVATEVEYIISVCRSMFDLLQQVASTLWRTVQLKDPAIAKKDLPTKFPQVIRNASGQMKSASDLAAEYGLPDPLVSFYTYHQAFFGMLTKFRNAIEHDGRGPPGIFTGDSEFLIRRNEEPFSQMRIWRHGEVTETGLVPLIPALNVVVHNTLAACDYFSRAVESVISFPKPLVPGMHLFVRTYFGKHITEALLDAGARVTASETDHPAAPE